MFGKSGPLTGNQSGDPPTYEKRGLLQKTAVTEHLLRPDTSGPYAKGIAPMKPSVISRLLPIPFLATLALLLGFTCPAGAADVSKPNILHIVADDLGWKDVGFHGSDIKTPNIDKLASTGVRLEQFYTQPFCTPTRAAI